MDEEILKSMKLMIFNVMGLKFGIFYVYVFFFEEKVWMFIYVLGNFF